MCGVMLSCPVPFYPALPRPAPSGNRPFSVCSRRAVRETALLGISTICRLEKRPSRHVLGRGEKDGPGARADRRRIPEPSAIPRSSAGPSSPGAGPGRPSPPRTATSRTRNPANADNRRFRGSRRFRRIRGCRFSRRGAVLRCAVRETALLGISAIWRLVNRPSRHGREARVQEPAPIGGASRNRPRSRARRRAPRPPVRPGAALPAENRDFPDAKSRERRQPPIPRRAAFVRASVPEREEAAGGSDGHAGCSRGISNLPSAEKNTPLGESPQLTVSF